MTFPNSPWSSSVTRWWRIKPVLLCLLLIGCGTESGDSPLGSAEQLEVPEFGVVPDATPDAEASTITPANTDTASAVPDPAAQSTAAGQSSPPATPPSTIDSANGRDAEAEAAAKLERELAEFTVPPPWLKSVRSSWDREKPWQEARLEIRRLLGEGDRESRREGLRLMWDYREKNDMGDGHEYSMYTFLGNEPLWAILAGRQWLAKDDLKHPPDFCIKALASLYVDRGMFHAAEEVLNQGLEWPLPEATWRRAEYLDALGDLHVAWGRTDEARDLYQESIQLYPQTNPPYGQHLIPRRVKIIQSKLDVLSLNSLEGVVLRDGLWNTTVPGYSGDIHVTAEVSQGRLAQIRLRHEEKIDQGSTVIVPRQIVDRQSLRVDAISGATITKDAIVSGTLTALRKAGLP